MNEEFALTHKARIKVASAERSAALFETLQERFGYDGDAKSVYPFDAEISNSLLDSHFTRMSPKTLKNYAEDSQKGVAFLQGHNWRGSAIGYSLSGEYQEASDKKRVIAGFYTVLGMNDTDNLVKRIKSGLSRDVSVGFGGGSYTCDICGRDIWDWDCRHIPGVEYTEKRGDEEYKVISTFTIDDARLSEVSDVFDGSTPDAMILRAQRMAAAGILTEKQIDALESRYRVALPHKKVVVVRDMGNLGPIPKEERKMTEEEFQKEAVAVLGNVRTELGLKEGDSLLDNVVALKNRVKELEPQAEDGRAYRKDLIDGAIESGVRAHGNDFDATMYRTTLENLPLASIKRMAADWEKSAKAALPAGRSTVDTEQRAPIDSLVSDEAYA